MSHTATIVARRAGAREWVALVVLTLAVMLLAVDATVLALAVPALTEALRPTALEVLWIGDIYSFAIAGLLVTMGNVADRIGRKRLLMIGAVAFGAASVLGAFSATPAVLIAARALLGLAGATIMPSTLAIIRDMFRDDRQRTQAIAVWSVGFTVGSAAGPLVGGLLLEHFWWGSVFLINVPVMVLVVGLGIFLLPESRNPNPGPIDLWSSALSLLAIVPVVYGIKHAAKGDLGALTFAAFALGIGAGWAFVRRQRRLDHPLVDVELFRNPAFSGAIAANVVSIFAGTGLLFFFSQYLQLVRGFSPLQAGLGELPMAIGAVTIVAAVALLVARWGRGNAMGAGLAVMALGLAALVVAESLPGYAWFAVALVVIGTGMGLAGAVATDAVVGAVPRERAGAASSISEMGIELGAALGIAVLGSLQTAIYRGALALPPDAPAPLRAAAGESLPQLADAAHRTGGAEAVLAAGREAFTVAMQSATGIAAVLTAAAAVIAWRFVPSERHAPSAAH
ncbi:MFS transporter [Microbacterium sp. Marseille-Q6965]|uniref:MFS transporter n=1 Tax=Microbacterium sp. Marseille-Q6965 TaxID=2965072 RepID=UPI0021B758C5|nr:MFS transporter [Microbacterium sp. Marseille-Q6965]